MIDLGRSERVASTDPDALSGVLWPARLPG
jgi:hypothetical protein